MHVVGVFEAIDLLDEVCGRDGARAVLVALLSLHPLALTLKPGCKGRRGCAGEPSHPKEDASEASSSISASDSITEIGRPSTWPARDISTDAAESGRLVASPTTRDDAVLAGGRALTGAGVLQVAAGSPNGSPDDDALM